MVDTLILFVMLNVIEKLVIKSWGLANDNTVSCYFNNVLIDIVGVNSTDGLRFFILFKTGEDFTKVFPDLNVGKISHKMCYKKAENSFEVIVILKEEELLQLEPSLKDNYNDSTPFLAEAFASRYGD